MFISYAQNFEDVILWRALKHVERGFYLDVGAQDPIKDSVSLGFYENGWRGVHVEANAHYAERLRQGRPDEDVLEVAIDRTEGEIEFFDISDTGLSTGDEAIARAHEAQGWKVNRRRVASRRLATVLDSYRETPIHWLKIDVEGMEAAVIDSWSPSTIRPWVVVVESTKPMSTELSHEAWEPKLLALGYEFVYFDKLNRFYVSSEHPELKKYFDAGPNVFDGFRLADTSDFISQDAETGHARLATVERNARTALDLQLTAERQTREAIEQQLAAECQTREAIEQQLAAECQTREAIEQQLAAECEIRTLAEGRYSEEEAARQAAEQRLAEEQGKRRFAEERLAEERQGRAPLELKLKEQSAARLAAEQRLNDEQAERAKAEEQAAAERASRHLAEAQLLLEQEQRSALEQRVQALTMSRSWRLTAPMRAAGYAVYWFVGGTKAWFLFMPGSRPRRVARTVAIKIWRYVGARPALSRLARIVVGTVPMSIQAQFLSIVKSNSSAAEEFQPPGQGVSDLSARARAIYGHLLAEQGRGKATR